MYATGKAVYAQVRNVLLGVQTIMEVSLGTPYEREDKVTVRVLLLKKY